MIVLCIKISSRFLYLTKEQSVYFWKKKGGGGWSVGGCYLVRALLFTERARARLVCDTVLLLQECCVCWLTMSILAFDRAGIKVHTLHQGDSIVTVLIHPPLSLPSQVCGMTELLHVTWNLSNSHMFRRWPFSQGEILIFLFFFSQWNTFRIHFLIWSLAYWIMLYI